MRWDHFVGNSDFIIHKPYGQGKGFVLMINIKYHIQVQCRIRAKLAGSNTMLRTDCGSKIVGGPEKYDYLIKEITHELGEIFGFCFYKKNSSGPPEKFASAGWRVSNNEKRHSFDLFFQILIFVVMRKNRLSNKKRIFFGSISVSFIF